jgi:peptide deformylase
MGRLKNEDWFKETKMTKTHEQLLTKCVQHDFHWIDDLIGISFSERWKGYAIRPFFKLFTLITKYKAKQAGINIKP